MSLNRYRGSIRSPRPGQFGPSSGTGARSAIGGAIRNTGVGSLAGRGSSAKAYGAASRGGFLDPLGLEPTRSNAGGGSGRSGGSGGAGRNGEFAQSNGRSGNLVAKHRKAVDTAKRLSAQGMNPSEMAMLAKALQQTKDDKAKNNGNDPKLQEALQKLASNVKESLQKMNDKFTNELTKLKDDKKITPERFDEVSQAMNDIKLELDKDNPSFVAIKDDIATIKDFREKQDANLSKDLKDELDEVIPKLETGLKAEENQLVAGSYLRAGEETAESFKAVQEDVKESKSQVINDFTAKAQDFIKTTQGGLLELPEHKEQFKALEDAYKKIPEADRTEAMQKFMANAGATAKVGTMIDNATKGEGGAKQLIELEKSFNELKGDDLKLLQSPEGAKGAKDAGEAEDTIREALGAQDAEADKEEKATSDRASGPSASTLTKDYAEVADASDSIDTNLDTDIDLDLDLDLDIDIDIA